MNEGRFGCRKAGKLTEKANLEALICADDVGLNVPRCREISFCAITNHHTMYTSSHTEAAVISSKLRLYNTFIH